MFITGYKDTAIRLFLVTTYKVWDKSKQSSTCRIQGVSGGIVNILGGGSMEYSECSN